MEFEGQYLTYQEYKGLGGTLDLMPFNLLEFEARRKIDIRTQNRLKEINSEDIPQEVKMCVYELINSISGYTNPINNIISNNNIKSENIDGYSVSYVNGSEISELIKSKSAELDDIIITYLAGIIINGEHIIFAGV